MSAELPIETDDRTVRLAAAAGQTAFPADFPILAADHVEVWLTTAGDRARLVLGADYTVSGVLAPAGFTVTLTAPAAAGDIVEIRGAAPAGRTTGLTQAGRYDVKAMERELDLRSIVDIEQGHRIDELSDAGLLLEGDAYDARGRRIGNVGAPVTPTDVVRVQDLSELVSGETGIDPAYGYLRRDGSFPMEGPLDMDGHAIGNLPPPVQNNQAANKEYVDQVAGQSSLPARLQAKPAVRSDINAIVESGWYPVASTAVGNPIMARGHVFHLEHPDTGYAVQRFMRQSAREEYERFKNGGTWSSWTRVLANGSELGLSAYAPLSAPNFSGQVDVTSSVTEIVRLFGDGGAINVSLYENGARQGYFGYDPNYGMIIFNSTSGDWIYLDTDGGINAVKFRDTSAGSHLNVLHTGNFSSNYPEVPTSAADIGALLASLAFDAVGQYGFFIRNISNSLQPGATAAGSTLEYATAASSENTPDQLSPSGSWRVHGLASSGSATLWQRRS